MKYQILISVLLIFVSTSCKDDIEDMLDEGLVLDGKVLYEGTFTGSGSYNVSGKASIIEKNGDKIIQFENFMSSSGPDLKVYISPEVGTKNALALGALKALSGNFTYSLPANFDFDSNGPFVLVYCDQFTVLFGSSSLVAKTN